MNWLASNFARAFAIVTILVGVNSARADAIVRITQESPVSCTEPCERSAVIFIHGILGSQATWENKAKTTSWPIMLAIDPELKGSIDVYRVDYDSFLFSAGPSIVDVLKGLEEQLDAILIEKQYKKVFLIGHSLGGNVARAYLMHIKAAFGHRALSSFNLTFTLGTPVQGSDLANIARLASSNQQIRVLRPIKINDFGQLLNLTLNDIENKHQQVFCPKLLSYAAYEKLPEPMIGLVVSEGSATASASVAKGFDRTHTTLVKPEDREDDVYKWVKSNMMACIKGSTICQPRTPACGSLPEGWPNPKFEVTPALKPGSSVPIPKVYNP